jgi:hypothetical protein
MSLGWLDAYGATVYFQRYVVQFYAVCDEASARQIFDQEMLAGYRDVSRYPATCYPRVCWARQSLTR